MQLDRLLGSKAGFSAIRGPREGRDVPFLRRGKVVFRLVTHSSCTVGAIEFLVSGLELSWI